MDLWYCKKFTGSPIFWFDYIFINKFYENVPKGPGVLFYRDANVKFKYVFTFGEIVDARAGHFVGVVEAVDPLVATLRPSVATSAI